MHTCKLFFLFLNQTYVVGTQKNCLQPPKHMIKLMDKKIIAILRNLFFFNWPYGTYHIVGYLMSRLICAYLVEYSSMTFSSLVLTDLCCVHSLASNSRVPPISVVTLSSSMYSNISDGVLIDTTCFNEKRVNRKSLLHPPPPHSRVSEKKLSFRK